VHVCVFVRERENEEEKKTLMMNTLVCKVLLTF
jgi:hypothetical protein